MLNLHHTSFGVQFFIVCPDQIFSCFLLKYRFRGKELKINIELTYVPQKYIIDRLDEAQTRISTLEVLTPKKILEAWMDYSL